MTDKIVDDVLAVAPTAPVVELAGAAIATAADPTPSTILADIELITTVAKELRAKLANVHPSLVAILKALF